MATKVKPFNSSMVGAPVLSGQAGTLVAVLDAVLVNGFGEQIATDVVISDGVATLTMPNLHAATINSVVLIAGSSVGALNGEQRVTAVKTTSPYSISFKTVASGTVTGTVTAKIAPAGWLKAHSDAGVASYMIIDAAGTGFSLRVDDRYTTVARVRGFETMSTAYSGTGPFPTSAQSAEPGLFWSKSSVASAAARPWRIIADKRGFFFFVKNGDASTEYQAYYFGDIISIKSNDPYACVLRGNSVGRNTLTYALGDSLDFSDATMISDGLYCARAAGALGGAVKNFQAPVLSVGLALNQTSGSVGWSYPAEVNNGLFLTPVVIYSAAGYRGYFPGLYLSPQKTNNVLSSDEIVLGSGDMSGKKVQVIKTGNIISNAEQGVIFIDITSDWR